MGKYVKIVVLVLLLVLVRVFQNSLFYDPFIAFFKRFVYSPTLPEFDSLKLCFNVFLRYLLNAILSLSLLYVVFKSKVLLKFATLFYAIAFAVLMPVFVILLFQLTENNVMPFFYIRRFLIHPIFILILLPAFYYQQLNKR